MDWLAPTNVTEVRSFMELVGYYRQFLVGFSRVAHPITSLQRKGKNFKWTERCEQAFQELKRELTSAPILAVPNPSLEFVVCTYASLDGIRAILMQVEPYLTSLGNSRLISSITLLMISRS